PYIGDRIGLASANGNVYAAWTDSRNGNQDIYFGSYSLAPAPVPLNDRYEPNDAAATATDLGRVSVERLFPRLSLTVGDQDWFKVTAAARGTLTVFVSASTAGQNLQLELRDADASDTVLPATVEAVTNQRGQVVGQRISFASVSGRDYLIRVAGGLVPL